jgi:hypothetical protein
MYQLFTGEERRIPFFFDDFHFFYFYSIFIFFGGRGAAPNKWEGIVDLMSGCFFLVFF